MNRPTLGPGTFFVDFKCADPCERVDLRIDGATALVGWSGVCGTISLKKPTELVFRKYDKENKWQELDFFSDSISLKCYLLDREEDSI